MQKLSSSLQTVLMTVLAWPEQTAIHARYRPITTKAGFNNMPKTSRLDDIRFMALKDVFDSCAVLRYRPGSTNDPKLVDGLYYENPHVDPAWALSVYRNVKTKGNEVEITVVPDRLPLQVVAGKTVENWLNTLKGQLQHLEPGRRGGKLPASVIRIGLKYEAAQVFAQALRLQLANKTRTQGEDPTWDVAQQMMQTVKATCAQSGTSSTVLAKSKECRFISDHHFFSEVTALLTSANGRCALSRVQLDFNGVNAEFSPSLDRKDSSGHYEPGNLQIVARFVNRWKSDMPDPQFMSLLEAVRSV